MHAPVPRSLVCAMLAALSGRYIFWLFLDPMAYHMSGDALFYMEAARSIAENFTYAINGEPTAVKPPLYPLFSGLLLALFRDVSSVVLIQYMFGVLAGLPVYFLAREFLDSRRAVALTTAYLFFPFIWHWESGFMSESLALWLSNLFLLFAWQFYRSGVRSALAWSAVIAALWFLTRPAALFPLAAVLMFMLWQRPQYSRMSVVGAWALAFVGVLSPWVIRNALVFDAFIPASTVAGVTLYTSYVHWGQDMSRIALLPEDAEVCAGISAVECDRYLLSRTLAHLAAKPSEFFALIPMKLAHYLHPFTGRWYALNLGSKFDLFYGMLASLAMLGLLWRAWRTSPLFSLAGMLVIGGLVCVIVFHGEVRYRLGIVTPMFLFAGCCFVKPLSSRRRHIVTAMAATNLLLWGIGIFVD